MGLGARRYTEGFGRYAVLLRLQSDRGPGHPTEYPRNLQSRVLLVEGWVRPGIGDSVLCPCVRTAHRHELLRRQRTLPREPGRTRFEVPGSPVARFVFALALTCSFHSLRLRAQTHDRSGTCDEGQMGCDSLRVP